MSAFLTKGIPTAVSLFLAVVLAAQIVSAEAVEPVVVNPFVFQGVDEAACNSPANAVVAENCLPGTEDWYVTDLGAIEGYASASSVQGGDELTFFVNTTAARFDIFIYRSGYYGGLGGRLITTINDVTGQVQPDCNYEFQTGLTTCSNWSASHTLTTPDDWLSGIYIAKLVRQDDGGENFVVFVVRQDERSSDVLYQQSTTTYQAYNYYGGKSIYNNADVWNACPTVTTETRAAKISLNRPYLAPMTEFNMYFYVEYPMVHWLEQQGYDVTYSTNMDTHRSGKAGAKNELLDHRIFLSVGHDEYWSQEMRDAVTQARDAGVHIGVFSSNTAYWRIRFEPDPVTGEADKVLVSYKSTQSGPADPVTPTGTWRDPLGINMPENALLGSMYLGDNVTFSFPIRVSAEQAQDSIFRSTGLQGIPAGTVVDIGKQLVGWEWDVVVENGLTPESLTLLANSPVVGKYLLDSGREYSNYQVGEAHVTRYQAESGALVFNAGTNQWSHGLALYEPNPILQQITYNLFADMGVQPASPTAGLVLDGEAQEVSTVTTYFDPSAAPAPTLSNIQVSAGELEATFTWETDVPTRGQVFIGSSPDSINQFGSPTGLEPATQHSVTNNFLRRGRTYTYQIMAIDQQGNVTFSDVGSFSTQWGGFSARLAETVRPIAGSVVCTFQSNPPVWIGAGLGVGVGLVLLVSRLLRRRRRS